MLDHNAKTCRWLQRNCRAIGSYAHVLLLLLPSWGLGSANIFQAQALTTRSTMATWSFVERRILDAAGSAAVVATSRGPQLSLSEPELLRFVAAFQQDVAVEWAHMGTTQMQQIS